MEALRSENKDLFDILKKDYVDVRQQYIDLAGYIIEAQHPCLYRRDVYQDLLNDVTTAGHSQKLVFFTQLIDTLKRSAFKPEDYAKILHASPTAVEETYEMLARILGLPADLILSQSALTVESSSELSKDEELLWLQSALSLEDSTSRRAYVTSFLDHAFSVDSDSLEVEAPAPGLRTA